MRDMLKRRRMLMFSTSTGGGSLPNTYREVLWLRGTGTQYCELDYYGTQAANEKTNIVGDITLLDRNTAKFAIMCSKASMKVGVQDTNSIFYFWHGTTSANKNFSGSGSIDLHYELNSDNVVLNNDTSSISRMNIGTSNNHFLVGAYYESDGTITIHNQSVNIKKFYIYSNDTLLTEVIPCVRKADGKPGFYQTNVPVGGTHFVTNLGTGSDWLIGTNA